MLFWACMYSANSSFFGMMLSDYLGLERFFVVVVDDL
jgi:hypothetical protein